MARHAGVEHRDCDARAVVLGRDSAKPDGIWPGLVGWQSVIRLEVRFVRVGPGNLGGEGRRQQHGEQREQCNPERVGRTAEKEHAELLRT